MGSYSKQFRLFADVLNDAALLVGVLASKEYFVVALCLRSALHALVGVAGAATRAAVVVHQARGGRGNVSDGKATAKREALCSRASDFVFSFRSGRQGRQPGDAGESGGAAAGLCAAAGGAGARPGLARAAAAHRPPRELSVSLLLCVFPLASVSLQIWANSRAVGALRFVHLNPLRLDLLAAAHLSGAPALPAPAQLNAAEPLLPLALLAHRRRWPPLLLGADPRSLAAVSAPPASSAARFILADRHTALFRRGATPADHLEAYFRLRGGTDVKRFLAQLQAAGYDCERQSLCVGEYSFE